MKTMKTMKTIKKFGILLLTVLIVACSSDDDEDCSIVGTWVGYDNYTSCIINPKWTWSFDDNLNGTIIYEGCEDGNEYLEFPFTYELSTEGSDSVIKLMQDGEEDAIVYYEFLNCDQVNFTSEAQDEPLTLTRQ